MKTTVVVEFVVDDWADDYPEVTYEDIKELVEEAAVSQDWAAYSIIEWTNEEN